MDRFLISNANKRPRSDDASSLPPVGKKPRSCAKQGNVTAAVRVAEFGKKLFYADGVAFLPTLQHTHTHSC